MTSLSAPGRGDDLCPLDAPQTPADPCSSPEGLLMMAAVTDAKGRAPWAGSLQRSRCSLALFAGGGDEARRVVYLELHLELPRRDAQLTDTMTGTNLSAKPGVGAAT